MKMDYNKQIIEFFDNTRDIILEKNKRYGNSALEPINIFCKLSSNQGILQRIDDKLMRIKNNTEEPRRNDVFDIIGYLSLYLISKGYIDNTDLID